MCGKPKRKEEDYKDWRRHLGAARDRDDGSTRMLMLDVGSSRAETTVYPSVLNTDSILQLGRYEIQVQRWSGGRAPQPYLEHLVLQASPRNTVAVYYSLWDCFIIKRKNVYRSTHDIHQDVVLHVLRARAISLDGENSSYNVPAKMQNTTQE
ncbi:hypothetical protein M422DRAFT_250223 [Sphaerobolus stellatus SS14]|uniref:Uncharacterized protein n=1 Tax=Sphaerobolus stellatus (strain SS14) TaxID=990650 RepID=A0A0C9V854_SPHS4|nr:hypothetical protein M422DRAFT_264385 [Sphaerobolus stellatus SS14]KIJ46182.1 hypothetical protein M422DRAFT_250223 [Sphaerobolus stellatus SS14]